MCTRCTFVQDSLHDTELNAAILGKCAQPFRGRYSTRQDVFPCLQEELLLLDHCRLLGCSGRYASIHCESVGRFVELELELEICWPDCGDGGRGTGDASKWALGLVGTGWGVNSPTCMPASTHKQMSCLFRQVGLLMTKERCCQVNRAVIHSGHFTCPAGKVTLASHQASDNAMHT